MDVREKLVELCEDLETMPCCNTYEGQADYLIANGVTFATDNNVGSKWISVKDRLPDKDEYVWCYSNKHGGYFFAGYRGWYTGEWMEGGCLHIGDVTHWMPLPQPPKGE